MILVVGATGQLGGGIARGLLGQGKQVRVLVRPGSDYSALSATGAEPVIGDLKDRASLDAACRGIGTVITTANSAQRGGDDNVETVDRLGNRNLIDAAKAAGVDHFIFVSALGADPNSPIPFVAAKGQTESYLRNSGLTYTILEPNIFLEVWGYFLVVAPTMAGQPVSVVGSGERMHSMISADDVLQFALAAVDNPAARNRTLVMGGPEPVCVRDLAATFGKVIGREVPIHTFRPGEPVPFLPEGAQGLAIMMDTFDSPIPMEETARTFGVKLTPAEEVFRRMAAQAR